MSEQYYDEYENREDLLEARRLRRLELKRKRMIQQRIIIAVLAVVLILGIIVLLNSCDGTEETVEKDQEEQIVIPEDETPDVPEDPVVEPDKIVSLAAVGDIMIYDDQIADAEQEDGTYDFSSCFSAISAYTLSSDLTVGNLELNFLGAPYTGRANAVTFFNAPESLATTLNKIGFDVLQTANTYSITNGMNGLESTIQYLNEAGIDHVGTYVTNPAESADKGVLIREVNGVRIAFLGFTKGLNGFSLPTTREYCVDLLYTDYTSNYKSINSTGILDRIDAAKSLNPDVIIAMVHWGSEFDLEVSESQKDITNLMFKNGVDVILGSHSHIVGPMEKKTVETVDGETKEYFVAYSLGNFVASMTKDYANESVILNLEFTKSGETGKTTISDIRYTPLYFADHGVTADNRFEILPIRNALEAGLFESIRPQMEKALDNLKTHSNSLYDSGK